MRWGRISEAPEGRARCSIVLPVHNQSSLTRQCLESVSACSPESVEFETIVVDDASSDETPRLLAGYDDRIRVVTHATNLGFAESCNEGAATAVGEYLVFLNSDTIATPGWLEALVAHAEANPQAAAVGAKLLYPNGTIQHAGVVICQDRYPRHLYAGFPGDHPAASTSRALQAVTGACMLVRREPFEQVGGFDPAFRNSYEDVDLCLRLREAGYEIRYCHESVLHHLESASRSRSSKDVEQSLKVYRSRWLGRVEPDDLRIYAEDGLLALAYDDTYPLRLSVSPLLAALTGERETEADRLLGLRARQVATLLRELTRLTGPDAKSDETDRGLTPAEIPDELDELRRLLLEAHEQLLERDEQLQAAIGRLRPAGDALLYPRLVRRIREIVERAVPGDATVLVVSKGDDELLRLDGLEAWHFPQEHNGAYAGRHPADGLEAVAQLEDLRSKGADFLLLPEPSFWWLDHYRDLRGHLERRYRLLVRDDAACAIYDLRREER